MKKVVVKLCCGTMCYVMGGADLQLLEDYLPEDLNGMVNIRAVPCLDLCQKSQETKTKAPYAMVGERVISGANNDKIIAEIRAQLNCEL